MGITDKRTIAFACATACAALSLPANATVTYNSPGSFSISTPVNDNVLVDHDLAVVAVEFNGFVRGLDTLTPAYQEAAVRMRRGTLNLTGHARVIAGLNQSAIEMTSVSRSDVRVGGRSAIHGNIKSDLAPIWSDEANATQRLYLQENGVVSGNVIYGGYLRLQDQAEVSGNIQSAANANLRIDMTGGFVSGNVALGELDNHIFNMSGGTISGTLGGPPSYVVLDMRGGYVRKGFRTLGAYQGVISGGYIDGGVAVKNDVTGGSSLSVRGGRFETVAGDSLFALTEDHPDSIPSTLKICGGQFGYFQKGTGLLIDGNTSLHVYGAGLTYVGGWLKGTLQDGSNINVPLTFGPSWTGTFTLNTVAVPSRPTC